MINLGNGQNHTFSPFNSRRLNKIETKSTKNSFILFENSKNQFSLLSTDFFQDPNN